MSSLKYNGVRFSVYPNDHKPAHVHGAYAETNVVLDLTGNGTIRLAARNDAIRPPNASNSDIRHILRVAEEHFHQLTALWEKHHG